MSKDTIYRQDAIKYFIELWECIGTICDREEWEDVCVTTVNEIKSAQQDCSECEEYDQTTHSCPRYCDVIKRTLEEAKQERKTGRWIDAVIPNDNGGLPVQVCDQCNTFFPLAYTGGGHRYCPNCGAYMGGEQDETD